MRQWALAVAALLSLGGAAEAAIVKVSFSGVFDWGPAFSGSFTYTPEHNDEWTTSQYGAVHSFTLKSDRVAAFFGTDTMRGEEGLFRTWFDMPGEPQHNIEILQGVQMPGFAWSYLSLNLAFKPGARSDGSRPASMSLSQMDGATLFFHYPYSAPDLSPGNSSYGVGFITALSTEAVPEPASWAMMLGGFALVGAGMRRRIRSGAAGRAG